MTGMSTPRARKAAPTKPAAATAPVASIVKKRSIIVPALIVIIVIAAGVLVYLLHFSSPRGDIVATVNGQPIYEADIAQTLALLPPQYQTAAERETVINQTIDETLLLQDAKRLGITVTDADVNANIGAMLNGTGKSYGDLDSALAARNMTRDQYRTIMRNLMIVDKLGQQEVSDKVTVSEDEIMRYYQENQSEFLPPAGGVRISHILVNNLSTAETIVGLLNDGFSFADLAKTYSIDNATAVAGGSLGIVKPGDAYVKPFLDAALALHENEYTRTPVHSQYGYHIIYRAPDLLPLASVRDQIRSTIQNAKEQAAFQALIDSLHASADIKFYTPNGTITQAKPLISLDDFATCVAGKATLYGASWSEALKEQQALFGDAFSKLTYVDCDAQPKACAGANVQKYPTWIIGGTQYGSLGLKDLASMTNCPLPASLMQ